MRGFSWHETARLAGRGELTPSPPRQAERGAPFSPRLAKAPDAILSPKGARAVTPLLRRETRSVDGCSRLKLALMGRWPGVG